MRDLPEELVSEIVSILADDIKSLKSATLVSHQLGVIARRMLFARYWVPIPTYVESFRDIPGPRSSRGRKMKDFLSLLDCSPDLACLIACVELDRSHFEVEWDSLATALKTLSGVSNLKIRGHSYTSTHWSSTPRSMKRVFLNNILPGLTALTISTRFSNLPSDLLNHAPLLSHLDIQSPLQLRTNSTAIPKPTMLTPLRQLTLGIKKSISGSLIPVIKLVEGRLDTTLVLTLRHFHKLDSNLLKQGLGHFTRKLSILESPSTTIPFNSLPVLQTLSISVGHNPQNPIVYLSESLQDQSRLPLRNLILLFAWYSIDAESNLETRNIYGRLDTCLQTSCPNLISIHATFHIEGMIGEPFSLDDTMIRLGELLPQSFQKGIISAENVSS
ncbi:hypothetical protein DL96DRAFT_1630881 [Flagelloscypha sp. PMI_526]|nr:hypothetical protein DL96DRAFT_1630881 [Flagelloscypha sp. PMI_526]